MRWIALAAVFCFSLPALAQTNAAEPEAEVPIERHDMGAIDIYGVNTKPAGMVFQGKRRPVFLPLLQLKRNFLPRTLSTAHATALR